MVGLSEVDYFSDELFANYDVDGFEVEVDDAVVLEIAKAVDDIEKDADLRPKGDRDCSCHDVEVEFVALDVFHEQTVGAIEGFFLSIIFRDEIRASSFHFRDYILFMF